MTTEVATVPTDKTGAVVPTGLKDILRKCSRPKLEEMVRGMGQTMTLMGEQIKTMSARMVSVTFEGSSNGFLELRQVGKQVLKIYVQTSIPSMVFDIPKWELRRTAPETAFNVSVASEGDLIDFERMEDLPGDQLVAVREWLRAYREGEGAPDPLRIEITNAKDVFQPAKILTVKRDDSGKLSGATIEPVG